MNHKNHEELLAGERVVGGIWGVVLGGTGPRRGPAGGSALGGGGEGEGTPATIAAPGGVVKLCTRPWWIMGGGVNKGAWPDSRL